MITFLIPTYNEKNNIKLLVDSIKKISLNVNYKILFVDDNSFDGSLEELLDVKKNNKNVNFIIRKENERDLTQSLILGLNKVTTRYTFVLDCDLQHDLNSIPQMFQTITDKNIDLVIGSRFLEPNQSINLNFTRKILSKIAIIIIFIFGIKNITDPLSGFFIIKTLVFKEIKSNVITKGYKILLTILFFGKNHIKYIEIPIKFLSRQHGQSKLNRNVIINFLKQILLFIEVTYLKKKINNIRKSLHNNPSKEP